MRPEFTNDKDAFHAFNDLMTTTGGDREAQHCAGDDFVCDLLAARGFPLLADAYRDAMRGWWYA